MNYKRYKYKKSMFWLIIIGLIIFTVVFEFTTDFTSNLSESEKVDLHRSNLGFAAFMLSGLVAAVSPQYFKRYVEFRETSILFNSFTLKSRVRGADPKAFNVPILYENITRIEAKFLPVLGLYKIIVNGKNIFEPIQVTWCMEKKNELFFNICVYAKRFNPNVSIDPKLKDYLERKMKNDI